MSNGRVLMEAEKRQICELYPSKTINELAGEFGVRASRIKQILVDAKIDIRKTGRRVGRRVAHKLTEEQKTMVAEFYETTSISELSKAFGVPWYTIKDALKEKGVTLRPQGATIKSIKIKNETSVRPLKKEEITMPMPALGGSTAVTLPRVTIIDEDLPRIMSSLLIILEYVCYDKGENPGKLEEISELYYETIHNMVSISNDILFAPKNFLGVNMDACYARLTAASNLLELIDHWLRKNDLYEKFVRDHVANSYAISMIASAVHKTQQEA